jgi:hypothetical protein
MRLEISIPQFVILDEIKNKKINQISIAVTYAYLIKADITGEEIIDEKKTEKLLKLLDNFSKIKSK